LTSDWVLAVGFEEKRPTVTWQVTTLLGELKATAAADVTELRGADADKVWAAVTGLQTRPDSRFVWKANVLPSRVAAFIAGEAVGDTLVHAHGLNGIVWLHAPVDRKPESAAGFGGALVTRRAPVEWKTPGRVWANHPRGDVELMRDVKRTLDPNNVFNPGRLFP
jgi:FAD/FMN-containing dehydrogenase